MEHPSGEFDNAAMAMADAVKRLRRLKVWDRWITFCAQGQGYRLDSYRCADVRMLCDKLDVGTRPLDVPGIIQAAAVGTSALLPVGQYYSVAAASAEETARLLDAIPRHHFGTRPFADGGDDYAVGAEW